MYKTFTFRKCTHFTRPATEVEIVYLRPFQQRTLYVTASTYDRFVALANSGQYSLEIVAGEGAVAWSLTRLR